MCDRVTSWGCCGLSSRHSLWLSMHFILCVFGKFIWSILILFQCSAYFFRFFMIYFYFRLNMTKILSHFFSNTFSPPVSNFISASFFCLHLDSTDCCSYSSQQPKHHCCFINSVTKPLRYLVNHWSKNTRHPTAFTCRHSFPVCNSRVVSADRTEVMGQLRDHYYKTRPRFDKRGEK